MLNAQQTELLSAIFMQLPNHETSFDKSSSINNSGLIVYQRSLIGNASKAMAITFTTLHSFVGEKVFTQLVQQYLIEELRTDYDWGEFGYDFPNFIAKQIINNALLLSEIASLDFVCHQSERSENVEVDLTSLNLLSSHDAYDLQLTLSSGTFILSSQFPLDVIINEMAELSEKNTGWTLTDVERKLSEYSLSYQNGDTYYFVVWRPSFKSLYAQIGQTEFNWLKSILYTNTKEGSLGHILDKQNEQTFSFVEWLPEAIQKQQLNSIKTLSV